MVKMDKMFIGPGAAHRRFIHRCKYIQYCDDLTECRDARQGADSKGSLTKLSCLCYVVLWLHQLKYNFLFADTSIKVTLGPPSPSF